MTIFPEQQLLFSKEDKTPAKKKNTEQGRKSKKSNADKKQKNDKSDTEKDHHFLITPFVY